MHLLNDSRNNYKNVETVHTFFFTSLIKYEFQMQHSDACNAHIQHK